MRFATLVIPAVLLAACTGTDGKSDDTSGFPPGDCEATLTMDDDIATVGTVTWTTDEPGSSWVEFGPNVTLGASTVPGPADETDHTVLLAGVPTGETWFWVAVTELADGTQLRCTTSVIDAGPRPRGTPSLEITEGPTAGTAPGYRALTSQIGESFTVLLNARGEDVWWWIEEEHTVVQRVLVADDGLTLTRMTAYDDFAIDESMIYRMRIDGEPLSETRIPMGHHDFVEIDDPTYTYAYLAADLRADAWSQNDRDFDVMGDSIVEISEDGSASRVVWSSWDSDVPLSVDAETDEGFYPQGLDWVHANSLQYLPETDSYLVSMRNLDQILNVSRADGSILWRFGGADSDFAIQGRAPDGQHSVELLDGNTLFMFDNGSHDDSWSQAVMFTLDFDAMTATEAWTYDAGRDTTAILLGDVERLPNGNVATAWGNAAVYTEVDEAGEVQLRLDAEIGPSLGYVKQVDAVGGAL